MRVVRPALEILVEAGISTMLCKGAALIVGYGRDPGARPMADVDVGGAAEPGTPCARDR